MKHILKWAIEVEGLLGPNKASCLSPLYIGIYEKMIKFEKKCKIMCLAFQHACSGEMRNIVQCRCFRNSELCAKYTIHSFGRIKI